MSLTTRAITTDFDASPPKRILQLSREGGVINPATYEQLESLLAEYASGGKVDEIADTLVSIDGKDFATQTTLAALLAELEGKADLTETQPVSVASLPLPSGAATETTLDNILTELTNTSGSAINDLINAVNTLDINLGDIDINTDGLETLQGTTNSKLDDLLAEYSSGGKVDEIADTLVEIEDNTNKTPDQNILFDGTSGAYDQLSSNSYSQTASAAVDVSTNDKIGIFVKNTMDVSAYVTIEISDDNTNWYRRNTTLIVSSNDNKYMTHDEPAMYLRVVAYKSATGSTGELLVTTVEK